MNKQKPDANNTIPEDVRTEIDHLQKTVECGRLPREVRQNIVKTIALLIVPIRRRRKTDRRIDAAYADYKANLRRLELYRKHIPEHDKKSRYRRRIEERRLMNAIHQRISRERRAARKLAGGEDKP